MEGKSYASSPHILIVAYPGQGNINPALRLAKRLASKGLTVTFSSSHFVAHRLKSNNDNSPISFSSPISIGRGLLRFDFFSDGWAVDDPRHYNLDHVADYHLSLRTAGSSSLADLIRRQPRPVSCVVSDIFVPWAADVARSFNIPSALFWIQSCAVFSIYYHYFNSLARFPSASDPDRVVSLPGLPALDPGDLPTYILDSNPLKSVTGALRSLFDNLSRATWVLANSFQELELDVVTSISAFAPNLRVIAVGPLADGSESDGGSNLWRAADEESTEWLDSQEAGSVVYVALGSYVTLSPDEMGEMSSGLVSSGSPFLWVVRDDSRHLLPPGFVEEINNSGKGMVVRWSSQERVLAHSAIACFVSHCGWNSTIEALAAGVPVIAYPHRGDQQPDAKFIADVYGVGVRLKAPVKSDELKSCIEEAVRGDKAEMMRTKALEWKEAARMAAADGGSSDRNIQDFVDEILRRSAHGV